MIDGLIVTPLKKDIDPHYKADVIKSWDELSQPQREMFAAVLKACARLDAAGLLDVQYPGWTTRYEIAAELRKKRLNDSEIERLKALHFDGFIFAAKRPNGHIDERGRWRPHNSSFVYRPNEDILPILAEMTEKRNQPEKPSPPKKPVEVIHPCKLARTPELYEYFQTPEAPAPESLAKRVWDALDELGAAFKYLLTGQFLRNDPFGRNKRDRSI